MEKTAVIAKHAVKVQIAIGRRQKIRNDKDLTSASFWVLEVRDSLIIIIHKEIPTAQSIVDSCNQITSEDTEEKIEIGAVDNIGEIFSSKIKENGLCKKGIKYNCCILNI